MVLKALQQQAGVLENLFFPLQLIKTLGIEEKASVHSARIFLARFRQQAGSSEDAIEELLLDELCLAHLKSGQLHALATASTNLEFKQVYFSSQSRLVGAICQLVSTLTNYRSAQRRNPPSRKKKATRSAATKSTRVPKERAKGPRRDPMSKDADRPRSPRRVAAGRANRQKRGPLTEEGRARLSEAARSVYGFRPNYHLGTLRLQRPRVPWAKSASETGRGRTDRGAAEDSFRRSRRGSGISQYALRNLERVPPVTRVIKPECKEWIQQRIQQGIKGEAVHISWEEWMACTTPYHGPRISNTAVGPGPAEAAAVAAAQIQAAASGRTPFQIAGGIAAPVPAAGTPFPIPAGTPAPIPQPRPPGSP